MSKYITIKFSNGEKYRIPAKVVAEDRADYYATKFEGEEGEYEDIFEDEMWVLDSEYELIDWMTGNMDWEDVKEYAEYIGDESINKSDEFTNAEKEVVEFQE